MVKRLIVRVVYQCLALTPIAAFAAIGAQGDAAFDMNGALSSIEYRSEDAVLQGLVANDPVQDRYPVLPYASGLRLKTGVIVHPSCLRPELLGSFSKADVEKKFNQLSTEAARSILNCGGRYPELKPYLQQWITQFRRTIFVCTRSTSRELGTLYPQPNNGVVGFASYDPSILKNGLIGTEKSLIDMEINLASHHSAFVFSSDTTQDIFSGAGRQSQGSLGLEAIIHEVFHLTELNNRVDHGAMEAVPVDLDVPCGDNLLTDRVKVLGLLCSGGSSPSDSKKSRNRKYFTTQEQFANRISRCGMNQGCKSIFTSGKNSIKQLPFWTSDSPSADLLDSGSATKLCKRLEQDGRCISERKKLSWRNSPRLEEISNRIEKNLRRLTPSSKRNIPLAWFDLFPEQAKRIKELMSDVCISTLLKAGKGVGENPGLFLTSLAIGEDLKEEQEREWNKPVEDSDNSTARQLSLSKIKDALEKKNREIEKGTSGKARSPCQPPTQIPELVDQLSQISALDKGLVNNALIDMLMRRASSVNEGSSAVVSFIQGDLKKDYPTAIRFLGGGQDAESLLEDYRQALIHYHPASDQYECVLGSVDRGIEAAAALLEVNRPARKCP